MGLGTRLASENFNAQKCEVVFTSLLSMLQSVKWMDVCCLALMLDVDEKASVIARVEEDVGWKRAVG